MGKWLAGSLLVAAALSLGLSGAQGGTRVSIIESWFIHAESVGDPVAVEQGFYAPLEVEVIAGGPGLSPIDRVMAKARAGEIVFGIDYPWNILSARVNQRLPLVVVSHDFQHTAMRILSYRPIESIDDITGLFATWIGYDSPIKAAIGRIWEDRVTVVNQQGDPATLGSFVAHQVDFASAMVYNEVIVAERLRSEGRIDPYFVTEYSDFGVDWPENVLFTTEDIIAQHPDIVQQVVTARYRGFEWARGNLEAAAQILLEYNPNLDPAHEIAGMQAIFNQLMVTDATRIYGLGYIDPAAWQRVAEQMTAAGLFETLPDVFGAFSSTFPSGVVPGT